MNAQNTNGAREILPMLRVDVLEEGSQARLGWHECRIGNNLTFDTGRLESYCFAKWDPLIFDMLLVAASVEFCDKICKRSTIRWGRCIECSIPVHDVARWQSVAVNNALHEALQLLTGDRWTITFKPRIQSIAPTQPNELALHNDVRAVMPYSDGLDSRAVAGLLAKDLTNRFVRVRLGTKKSTDPNTKRLPFAAVPYAVRAHKNNLEGSGRSRGFKFTLIGGVAAYLSGAPRVVMPESAQGSLGPVLVPVGPAQEDYRNHPRFTDRMSVLLKSLLGQEIRFEFPRLWYTKGETISAYIASQDQAPWLDTHSCWQQSRQASVDGHKRQCGICAACLLRRMSIHAAGLQDPANSYVWEDLSVSQFANGAAASFKPEHITTAMKEYAIAGTLHLDHLASIWHSPANAEMISHSVFHIAKSVDLDEGEVSSRLKRVLGQHESEWRAFLGSLGPRSFLLQWMPRS